jgi:hypothetical protein
MKLGGRYKVDKAEKIQNKRNIGRDSDSDALRLSSHGQQPST